MATDIERLIVTLEASSKKFENELKRARGVTNREMKAIEDRGNAMQKKLGLDFTAFSRTVAAGIAGVASLKGFQDLIDANTRVQNSLKVAGLEGDALARVYDQLFASAQRNSVPIETMAQLYGRLAVIQGELNVSSADVVNFADKIGLALKVAGTDAQAASGALLQLSQALGGGTVRAEEFTSILDGALPILQAAARGIKEAGGSVATLRKLVLEGKVSSQALFQGFIAGSKQLEEQAGKAVSTVEQGFTRLRNAAIDAAGKIDVATGAGAKAAGVLDSLATYVTDLSTAFGVLANGPIGSAITKLQQVNDLIGFLIPQINALKNLPNDVATVANAVSSLGPNYQSLAKQRKDLQAQLDRVMSEGVETYGQDYADKAAAAIKTQIRDLDAGLAQLYGDRTRPLSPTKPTTTDGTAGSVSLNDFPVTPPKSTKTGGTKSLDDYQKALEATNKQTAATAAETAARAKLNPLVEDYGFAIAKATKEQELLTAAKEAGKPIDAAMTAEIQRTATAYAAATAEAAKLEATQEKVRESVQFQKDVVNGALSDMRTALEDGKLTWEDLGNVAVNALNKIADRLQTMAVDLAFSKGFSGIFGAFGGTVAAGSTGGASVAASAAKASSVSAASAMRLPSTAAMKAAQAVTVDVRTYMDENGNWQQRVEHISGGVAAKVGKTGLEKYRAGQGKLDTLNTVRSPRRRGMA